MVNKNNKTNPILLRLIHELKKQSNKKNISIWKDVALRLEKSSKNWPKINLERINKNTKETEIALIPGKVLSDGNLTKKITIAAWSFSEKSKEKIKKVGGKYISIDDLLRNNPKGENIRILG